MVPKGMVQNMRWRKDLLKKAYDDPVLQHDLLIACQQSKLFWINAFCWTFHQWDVDPKTGKRKPAKNQHVPFVTWAVQDNCVDMFDWCLENGEDILVNKSRDMGASWCCMAYIHWHWLFTPNAQMLEMSRTKEYVDQTANMKALFPKHDYMNRWLPWWMRPPECLPEQKNRSCMHLFNELNGACIDGESTTEHAASGDRRLIVLLDEFAKVKHGRAMRSATRDAGIFRIINSTVAGPGTEYSNWKNSGQIKIFPLMWWDHPEKGCGRYVQQEPVSKEWKIRSPWYNYEETVRSPKEMAQEVDADDIGSGNAFFHMAGIDTHSALFACKPRVELNVEFKKGIADDAIPSLVRSRGISCLKVTRGRNTKLKLWCRLIGGRPNQNHTYVFGMDISKGMGASNSVISVRCVETGEKVAEWACAQTLPVDMARAAVALALWFGGRGRCNLPFMIWEKNGPGLNFGKRIVKMYHYPRYYKTITIGNVHDQKSDKYGWQSSTDAKYELMTDYDHALAYGEIINHSALALDEARKYITYGDNRVGPACLVEEDASARKTHGDRVIADALTLLGKKKSRKPGVLLSMPQGSAGHRKLQRKKSRKKKGWRHEFDNR